MYEAYFWKPFMFYLILAKTWTTEFLTNVWQIILVFRFLVITCGLIWTLRTNKKKQIEIFLCSIIVSITENKQSQKENLHLEKDKYTSCRISAACINSWEKYFFI